MVAGIGAMHLESRDAIAESEEFADEIIQQLVQPLGLADHQGPPAGAGHELSTLEQPLAQGPAPGPEDVEGHIGGQGQRQQQGSHAFPFSKASERQQGQEAAPKQRYSATDADKDVERVNQPGDRGLKDVPSPVPSALRQPAGDAAGARLAPVVGTDDLADIVDQEMVLHALQRQQLLGANAQSQGALIWKGLLYVATEAEQQLGERLVHRGHRGGGRLGPATSCGRGEQSMAEGLIGAIGGQQRRPLETGRFADHQKDILNHTLANQQIAGFCHLPAGKGLAGMGEHQHDRLAGEVQCRQVVLQMLEDGVCRKGLDVEHGHEPLQILGKAFTQPEAVFDAGDQQIHMPGFRQSRIQSLVLEQRLLLGESRRLGDQQPGQNLRTGSIGRAWIDPILLNPGEQARNVREIRTDRIHSLAACDGCKPCVPGTCVVELAAVADLSRGQFSLPRQ